MDKQHWFPAKRPGCGWGWPLGWQGWVPPATCFLPLNGGAILLAPGQTGRCLAGVLVLGAPLAATRRIAGEPPRHAFRGETLR